MIAFLTGSATLFGLFIVLERRAAHSLIPTGLLKHASLLRAVIGLVVFGAILGPSALFSHAVPAKHQRLRSPRDGFILPQEIALPFAAAFAGRSISRLGTDGSL